MESNSDSILIVGLGNPGARYTKTLHNLGFEVVDELSRRLGGLNFQKGFKGLWAQTVVESKKVFLLKPQTYMNLSGESVQETAHYFKVPSPGNIWIISDDLDLPPGALRIRTGGGPGGHNGLKSVIECLGDEGFPRLRMGIGRHPQMPADAYVLKPITSKEETELYQGAIKNTADAIEVMLKQGIAKAMNQFNQKRPVERPSEEE